MGSLRLIVPCTKRKRLPAGALAMGRIKEDAASAGLDAMVSAWWRHAESAAQEATLPALQLYQGAQWPIVADARGQCPSHLHILSAGLGLLSEDDRVPGYDATFSSGVPDTVKAPGMSLAESRRCWWQRLGERRLPGQSGPRSLATLMADHPDDCYLVAASPPYVQAIADDLMEGAERLENPRRQLLVVTSGDAAALPASQVLRSRQAMRETLGGGMITLNMRLAAAVMARYQESGDLGAAAEAFANQTQQKRSR